MENSRSTRSPVLRSGRVGWSGRSACQACDGLAARWVDGLGEGGAGLVHRDVEQADSILDEDSWSRRRGDAFLLPADAADAQPGDLVAAQPGEQPGQGEGADERERVVLPAEVPGRSWACSCSPAQISLAQTSSAMTRGSVPMRAATLRGMASARVGSKRRAIQSHSWQSRKNARLAVRKWALVRGRSGPRRVVRWSRRWV